ncbi:MAG TPA: FixH family protein [Polyangiaceae bacterium]|jgi:hypothetical protein
MLPLSKRPLTVLLAVALTGLAGCGASGEPTSSSSSGAPAFPATPLATVVTMSGQLHVEVRTIPQPPSRGLNTMELAVRDASGAPSAGLTLSVVPWMTSMGHGASVTPTATETAPGTYVVTDVDFAMPGTWEMRTTISGPVTDYVAFPFQIP